MSLDPIRRAIARALHITPADPMTTQQIQQLTTDLGAAQAKVVTVSQQLASTTSDLATARQHASDAESQVAQLTAQLAALPDPAVLGAMAQAAQNLVNAVNQAQAAAPAPAAS